MSSYLMLLSLTIFSLLFSLLCTTKEMSSVTAQYNDVDVTSGAVSIEKDKYLRRLVMADTVNKHMK